jgi:hypothetical protein
MYMTQHTGTMDMFENVYDLGAFCDISKTYSIVYIAE